MNVQIFGTKKSFDSKKAERYFKERGIKYQFVDMKEKGLSKGEFNSVCQAVGGYEKLIDPKCKDKNLLALVQYLSEEDKKEKILEINHMKISFCQYQKGMHQTELPVISDLNVTVRAGEMVAIVGSSGSGKSLLAHGILGILPYNASMKGGIQYCGEPLTEKKIRKLRGKEIVLVGSLEVSADAAQT